MNDRKIETHDVSTEELDRILDRVPLNALSHKGELEFWLTREPELCDIVSYFQYLIDTRRIYEMGHKTQEKIKQLYELGILFDHSDVGMEYENDNYKRKLTKEEIMAEPVKAKKERTLEDMWLCPPRKKGAQYE